MAIYNYEGKSFDGKPTKGEIDASSRSEAVSLLRKQNTFPIKVELKEKSSKEINISFKNKKVNNKTLAILCRQFAAILDAGISIIECLDILRKQSENKMLREALDNMYNEVQKGITLSISMKAYPKVFPTMLVNMVSAGEYSGALADILHRMTEHFEKEDKIQSKVKSAMIYPKILAFVTFTVTTVLLVFVLPNFAKMFADMGAELPMITQVLTNFGSFIADIWYIPTGIIIIVSFIFYRFKSTEEGRISLARTGLKVPIFGDLQRKVATSRFSRTLGSMLKSGIPIIEAFEQVTGVIGNEYITSELINTIENIKRGDGISAPLAQIEVFPPMLISMIRIGEETGTMDDLLVKTSEFYDQEVERAVEAMIQALNPLILLVLTAVIVPILIAIALPMFDMYNHMM